MRKSPKFSPEVMDRAVRMVFDAKDQYPSQWAAIEIDRRQDRLHSRDAAQVGAPGRARQRRTARPDHRRTAAHQGIAPALSETSCAHALNLPETESRRH